MKFIQGLDLQGITTRNRYHARMFRPYPPSGGFSGMIRLRIALTVLLVAVSLVAPPQVIPARSTDTEPVIVDFLEVSPGASVRTIFETWGPPDNQTLFTSNGDVKTIRSESPSAGKGRRKILQYRKEILGETVVLNCHLNSEHRLYRIWGLISAEKDRDFDAVWERFREYLLNTYAGTRSRLRSQRGTKILFLRDPVKPRSIWLTREDGPYPVQIQFMSRDVPRG